MAAAAMFFATGAPIVIGAALIASGVASNFSLALATLHGAGMLPTGARAWAISTAWTLNRAAAVLAPLVLLPLVASETGGIGAGDCVALASGAIPIIGARAKGAAGAPVS